LLEIPHGFEYPLIKKHFQPYIPSIKRMERAVAFQDSPPHPGGNNDTTLKLFLFPGGVVHV